jgi:hypothetical protein
MLLHCDAPVAPLKTAPPTPPNTHTTPSPTQVTVRAEVPAIMMEEAAPAFVSAADMRAPEEAFGAEAGGRPQAEQELTREDRRRRRATVSAGGGVGKGGGWGGGWVRAGKGDGGEERVRSVAAPCVGQRLCHTPSPSHICNTLHQLHPSSMPQKKRGAKKARLQRDAERAQHAATTGAPLLAPGRKSEAAEQLARKVGVNVRLRMCRVVIAYGRLISGRPPLSQGPVKHAPLP